MIYDDLYLNAKSHQYSMGFGEWAMNEPETLRNDCVYIDLALGSPPDA